LNIVALVVIGIILCDGATSDSCPKSVIVKLKENAAISDQKEYGGKYDVVPYGNSQYWRKKSFGSDGSKVIWSDDDGRWYFSMRIGQIRNTVRSIGRCKADCPTACEDLKWKYYYAEAWNSAGVDVEVKPFIECSENVFVKLKGVAHSTQLSKGGTYKKHTDRLYGERPYWLKESNGTTEDRVIWYEEGGWQSGTRTGWNIGVIEESNFGEREFQSYLHTVRCTAACPTECSFWRYWNRIGPITRNGGRYNGDATSVEVQRYRENQCHRRIEISIGPKLKSTHSYLAGRYDMANDMANTELEGLPTWNKKDSNEDIVIAFKEGKWEIGKRSDIKTWRGDIVSTSSETNKCPEDNQSWQYWIGNNPRKAMEEDIQLGYFTCCG